MKTVMLNLCSCNICNTLQFIFTLLLCDTETDCDTIKSYEI